MKVLPLSWGRTSSQTESYEAVTPTGRYLVGSGSSSNYLYKDGFFALKLSESELDEYGCLEKSYTSVGEKFSTIQEAMDYCYSVHSALIMSQIEED